MLADDHLLTLLNLFGELGVKKIRFTGGEPFMRQDFLSILEKTIQIPQFKSVNISTNGYNISKHIEKLTTLPLDSINFHLPSLEEKKFKLITGKNNLDEVLEAISMLAYGKTKIKVNCVVIPGMNENEIADIAHLAKLYPVDVRFCEVIPHDKSTEQPDIITSKNIFARLKYTFPEIQPAITNTHNASMYEINGFLGRIGIIGGYSRNFCSDCNKLKLSPSGSLKLCSFDAKSNNLGQFVRYGYDPRKIKNIIQHSVKTRYFDGYAAEEAINSRDEDDVIEML